MCNFNEKLNRLLVPIEYRKSIEKAREYTLDISFQNFNNTYITKICSRCGSCITSPDGNTHQAEFIKECRNCIEVKETFPMYYINEEK